MVQKLNKIAVEHALSGDPFATLAQARVKQLANDRSNDLTRFAPHADQESFRRVDGEESRLFATLGPQEARGRIADVYGRRNPGASPYVGQEVWEGGERTPPPPRKTVTDAPGRAESAKELQAKALQQIRDLLAGRERQSARYSTFDY